MNKMQHPSLTDFRNLMIRYPDRLMDTFGEGIGKAVNCIFDCSRTGGNIKDNDIILEGVAGAIASLVTANVISNSDAGRLMGMMDAVENEKEFFYPSLAVTTIGMIVAWYGDIDDKGKCTINKKGVKEFYSILKKWGSKGIGLRLERCLNRNLVDVFVEYMQSLIDVMEKRGPEIEVRYSTMGSDRVELKDTELDEELKFIVDCPSIAVSYYDHYLKLIRERAKEFGKGDSELSKEFESYDELYNGFYDIAKRYSEDETLSLNDISKMFYEHLDHIDKKYPDAGNK